MCWNYINDREVDGKKYITEQIIGLMQKNERTHHVVQWYKYTTKDNTVEILKHFPD